jgi:hypothetical protein
MKVYITKHALTEGIYEIEAEKCEQPDMISFKGPYCTSYFFGKDWHKTRSDAVKRAYDMKETKIKSIKRQLQKIEALIF